jgi:RNA 3'-terminal phosphate cyclase-like protein
MELTLRSPILVCEIITAPEISSTRYTGTAILLKPGIITGGPITHDCPVSRSIGYFLEPLIMLAPFAKRPLQLTLRGVTSDEYDLSVSTLSVLSISVISLKPCRWISYARLRFPICNCLVYLKGSS